MSLLNALKREGILYASYARFELLVSAILLLFVSAIIIYSMVLLAITLFNEFAAGTHLIEATALKDTFGLILTILILIEFNHSIALALQQRSGVLQVRVIILIAIIVIARKLILLDYAVTSLQILLGLGGLALSLGALYWLLSDIEQRRRASGSPDE